MTLSDFKADPKLMKAAADLRGNSTYQLVVSVLEDEFRKSMSISPLHLPEDDKSFRLGEITGFNRALQMLRTIADPPPTPLKQIEATFGAQLVSEIRKLKSK